MTMRYDFDSGDPVDHPQVTVDVALGPQTLTIKVDENLAELVKALWARGFRTVASCQNQHGGGLAWIGFENQSMAVRFAGMVPSAQIVKMAAEARERADLADPFLHGAVAVTFPAALIESRDASVHIGRESWRTRGWDGWVSSTWSACAVGRGVGSGAPCGLGKLAEFYFRDRRQAVSEFS